MATKRSGGGTKNGRDSSGRRLGFKKTNGSIVKPGNIIFKQRGTKFKAGINVKMGRDHTLFSISGGKVFIKKGGNYNIVTVIK